MAKSKISEPAFSLISETALDMKGMAVAGFPGATEDNLAAHEKINFVTHYMSPKGKTVTPKVKQISVGSIVLAEFAPDPLDLLIAAEESSAASIKAFAEYAALKEAIKHDPFVAKAELEFLVKHGKLKQEGALYVPTGGVK